MKPFPELPYPYPPAYCYLIFEFGMYVLFILCLIDAVKRGTPYVAYLLGGFLFGLLLEYINVISNMHYVYGRFSVMLGTAPLDIPLCIGLGWGIIMYSGRLFSDSLKLPLLASAAVDTLFAISIDLSMDVVAYRLHMWHWDWSTTGLDPLTAQWFGVPWGNFFGWLMVVFFYASIFRQFQKVLFSDAQPTGYKIFMIPIFTVLVSQVFLYAMLKHIDPFLKDHFGITSLMRFTAFIIVLIIVVFAGWRKRKGFEKSSSILPWLVPLWCHVFFTAWLFLGGFHHENGWIVVAAILNALVSLGVHRWYFSQLTKPSAT